MCLSDYSYVSTCPAFCVPVKEKLTADPDSEIATTSLRVSLICPVNKVSASDCYQSKIHILMTTVAQNRENEVARLLKRFKILTDRSEGGLFISDCTGILKFAVVI